MQSEVTSARETTIKNKNGGVPDDSSLKSFNNNKEPEKKSKTSKAEEVKVP